MGSSTAIALLGIWLGYLFYGGGYRAPAVAFAQKMPGLVRLVRDKFRVDELYGFLVVRPLRWLCHALFLVVDRVLIDRILVGAGAFAVDLAGRAFRFVQAGDVQRYLAVFGIGLAALLWFAARPACPDRVEIVVEGRVARVTLADAEGETGRLKYSFDFDGDGTTDREGKSPTATWIYGGPDHYTVAITIEDARWRTRRTLQRDIEVRP
jgi:NADH-quinone oxidoreductase subunit L